MKQLSWTVCFSQGSSFLVVYPISASLDLLWERMTSSVVYIDTVIISDKLEHLNPEHPVEALRNLNHIIFLDNVMFLCADICCLRRICETVTKSVKKLKDKKLFITNSILFTKCEMKSTHV